MTETGLPELPEGYFWRVGYRRINLAGYNYPDKNRLRVELIHKYVTTRTRTERKWFRNVTTTEEFTHEVSVLTEDAQGTRPIAVLDAANRIMKLWARAKERDALVGDYPPKKLELA